MVTIVVQVAGVILFLVGTVSLRRWLKRNPTPRVAEWASRISHLLFHLCLFWPFLAGSVYQGFEQFDGIVGVRPLPIPHVRDVVGAIMLTVGIGLAIFSFKALGFHGKGAPSFILVKQIVADGLYKRTRNPLALGWYLFCVGLSLLAGSMYLTLYAVLALVAAHLFYLKQFEELELEIRFCEAYRSYKQTVPFLFPRPNAIRSDTWAAHEPPRP